ncbi:MAG: IS481 family transposase [Acidimicrobiales bacterium]|jgi:transposase InsO family protein
MVVRQMVVDAVLLEGRSVREVARTYGVSKTLVAKLVQRYKEGGPEALEPRSRAHRTDPNRTLPEFEDRIVELRKELLDYGVDAGAATIQSHLARELSQPPSISTIHRVLVRRGFINPQPKKRPKSSYIRFEADQPNEMWQSDFTDWFLTTGRKVQILNFIDDHSRLLIASRAVIAVTGADVMATFLQACENWGTPACVLTDNGAVYNAISRHGRTAFECLLDDLGVNYKHSRPYHPQTQGKIERWHSTLKKWLDKHPASTLRELQRNLDEFVEYYNDVRPHRSRGRITPAAAYGQREKARPGTFRPPHRYRVRHDVVDGGGKVSLRHHSRFMHIYVGRQHIAKRIILHIVNNDVRVLSEDYKLIGQVTLDPNKTYQSLKQVD